MRIFGKGAAGMRIIGLAMGGIPLLTVATCDPDTRSFSFLRVSDFEDIVEDVLDLDFVDDAFDDGFYFDCYYDCYY